MRQDKQRRPVLRKEQVRRNHEVLLVRPNDEDQNDPAPYFTFRVAVREVEAWPMADAASLSSFLSVAGSRMPVDPEQLIDPKTEMVNLTRRSRRREIREDMVPRDQSGRSDRPKPRGSSNMFKHFGVLMSPSNVPRA